jgi:hypothetical protein
VGLFILINFRPSQGKMAHIDIHCRYIPNHIVFAIVVAKSLAKDKCVLYMEIVLFTKVFIQGDQVYR